MYILRSQVWIQSRTVLVSVRQTWNRCGVVLVPVLDGLYTALPSESLHKDFLSAAPRSGDPRLEAAFTLMDWERCFIDRLKCIWDVNLLIFYWTCLHRPVLGVSVHMYAASRARSTHRRLTCTLQKNSLFFFNNRFNIDADWTLF